MPISTVSATISSGVVAEKKRLLHGRVALHLMAQVIDRIKQGFGCGVHAAAAGGPKHYAGACGRSS